LAAGQVVSGSFTLPVTTLENGGAGLVGENPYPSITINFVASSIPNTSVLAFNPTTLNFGRVLQGFTPSKNATLVNNPANGTAAGNLSAVASTGLSGPAVGTANPGSNQIAIGLTSTATATTGLFSGTYVVTNTSTNSTDNFPTGKMLYVSA